ncbi:DNA repair protein RecN [Candidatus Margulisiibacteriota bacterium]
MLNSLKIKNYALIDELDLDFKDGFNVLTGETGAGKSIIVGALSMVLGERVGGGVVRTGKEKAYVDASFDITNNSKLKKALKELGFEGDSQVIISREAAAGKTQAKVNGRAITQSALRSISRNLIDIHGQHEHQSLLQIENHIYLLDSLGGRELLSLRGEVSKAFNQLQQSKDKLNNLKKSAEEREKQIDFAKFQIKEIEEAGLKEGEEKELEQERSLLANAEKISEKLSMISGSLKGEGLSVVDKLKEILSEFKDIAEVDKSVSGIFNNYSEATYQIEDISRELENYKEKLTFNPKRLEEVEDRIHLLKQLKKKYGQTIKDIHKFKEDKKKELTTLVHSDEEIGKLGSEVKKLSKEMVDKAVKLSNLRKTVAKDIEKKAIDELEELNMKKVKFKVDFRKCASENSIKVDGKDFQYNEVGIDDIEFLISPNPGEPLKPLAKIASGGEISRIMLALKTILMKTDLIPTMIFDEIDVGIGGNTATSVGDKLSKLSKAHQVICITHLPQIASFASSHLFVDKTVKAGRTSVEVKELGKNDKIKELARMVSGKVTDSSLKTAEEMLHKK